MKATKELFLDYEAFLSRNAFYEQRHFACEVTGRSGITYFEAAQSEVYGLSDAADPAAFHALISI